MDRSKLYVPNPQHWIEYFKNYKPQYGRGFAIPCKSGETNSCVTINPVSTVEQTVLRAKSELERGNSEKSQKHTHKKVIPTKPVGGDNSVKKRKRAVAKRDKSGF